MLDIETFIISILILILSIFHTLGEALYKKGSTLLIRPLDLLSDINSYSKDRIKSIFIIGVSIGISFIVKILFGIILVTNPLSISSGLFLGFIAIFSVLFGKIFFTEQITRFQGIGIVLIFFGMILLV